MQMLYVPLANSFPSTTIHTLRNVRKQHKTTWVGDILSIYSQMKQPLRNCRVVRGTSGKIRVFPDNLITFQHGMGSITLKRLMYLWWYLGIT